MNEFASVVAEPENRSPSVAVTDGLDDLVAASRAGSARLPIRAAAGIGAMLALLAGPLLAQPTASPLSGHASLGVRSVDVGGAVTKFREDVNLDDGVRLFDLSFRYVPESGEDGAVDRVELDASNLGGDPFESVSFTARKFGAYTLKFDRRRSEYFYNDTILPAALASVTASNAGDFHTFDFERTRDRASLDITVSPATEVRIGLERFTRTGESTTTLDIQRDEFELDRPIDESLDAVNVGVQHAWDKVTLVFEQSSRKFDNAAELLLPGASTGENTSDPAELLFFRLDQQYDYSSSGQLLRLIATPTARLNVLATFRQEDLDLDMQAAERSAGTDFLGAPFTTDASGPATIGRDIEIGQVEVGYAIGERLRLTGQVRDSRLEQSGRLLFGGATGSGLWDIDTSGTEIGIEYAATSRAVLALGISSESRDVRTSSALDLEASSHFQDTERDGFFARLSYATAGGLEIDASVEDDDIDNAYTLASPTASRRYRVQARRTWDTGLSLSAIVQRDERDNSLSGWSGDTDQINVRVAYTAERVHASLGVSLIDLSRSIDQTVTGGSRSDRYLIDFDTEPELFDGNVRWRVRDRIVLGASFNTYDTAGSFALERDDYRIFVEKEFAEDYALRFAYRTLDYSEDAYDDYDAELLEAAVRVRW